MTKKLFSKILMLALVVGVFGVMRTYAQAPHDEDLGTSTDISNVSPVITQTPSDGGSANGTGTADTAGNPTNVGSNVTFSGKAHDTNSDSYYLAICKTDAVTGAALLGAAPTCGGGAWGVSDLTANDVAASKTYTALVGDIESNDWYAFVCDNAVPSVCYPATGAGDKGFALGTVTFTDVPADGNSITIDSKVYEFNKTGDCEGGVAQDVCVNVIASEDGAQAAAALAAAETGDNTHMTSRGAVTYVYADVQGVGGNAYGLVIGTCPNCSVSAATLLGGSDDNKMPFHVNHSGTFGTVAFTDATDGTIAPGDTIKFTLPNAQMADPDLNGAAANDTYNVYICSGETDMGGVTTAFNYTTNTCTGGTLLCSDTGVAQDTEDAVCSDGTGSGGIVSVPTAHGTYDVMVYVEDNHDFPAVGTALQTFTVIDVPPVYTGYTASDNPAPAAGGSDTVDFSVAFTDDNGDGDVISADGVFFDLDDAVTNTCSADENNCYLDSCTLTDNTSGGSNKTATGSDNTLGATCQVTVWFNANASANWEVNVKATDQLGVATFVNSDVNRTNPALQGIDIVAASIAYGTVAIGGTSAGVETSIGNVGNQILDVLLGGTVMTSGGNTIPVAQQKWHQTDIGFDWDGAATNPGPWAMVSGTGGTGDEVLGCINRDIAVRHTNHASTSETNESIYWKIRIPASQQAGAYTGANTFTSTATGTCSGTLN